LANTFTNAVQLAMPGVGDRSWSVPLNGNSQILDALNPIGDFNCTTVEVPSASLNVKTAAGQFTKTGGGIVTFAGATIAATASATSVIYLDGTASWALTVGTAYPATAHLRIATVVAGTTTITGITDNRQSFVPSGSLFDGTVFVVGTGTGLQIASAANQKLGFFGKAGVTQPVMGAATASTTFGTTESAMLNAVYAAVRALGLGS
jgi:hypothetical protein